MKFLTFCVVDGHNCFPSPCRVRIQQHVRVLPVTTARNTTTPAQNSFHGPISLTNTAIQTVDSHPCQHLQTGSDHCTPIPLSSGNEYKPPSPPGSYERRAVIQAPGYPGADRDGVILLRALLILRIDVEPFIFWYRRRDVDLLLLVRTATLQVNGPSTDLDHAGPWEEGDPTKIILGNYPIDSMYCDYSHCN